MTKKVTKPNTLRGQIFDKLAETFGTSVLGMYEGKLRIEILNDDGEPVQFSLAPVVHKNLVDEEECDELVPITEQVAAYEAVLAEKEKERAEKKAATEAKKQKQKKNKEKGTTAVVDTPVEAVEVELTEEEKDKLDKLSATLDSMF